MAIDYISSASEQEEIYIQCDFGGYCPAFQYLFEIKEINVKEDNNADGFRIFEASNADNKFGRVGVERIEKN